MLFGNKMAWISGGAVLALAIFLAVISVTSPQVVFLGARNVFRNARRTLITTLVICFGVSGIMLLSSFMENAFTSLQEATITSGVGHLQLFRRGYNEQGGIDKSKFVIDDYDRIKRLILSDPAIRADVRRIAATLEFTGLVASAQTSAMCMGRGVELDSDASMSAYDRLVDGQQMGAGQLQDDGLVGRGLSKAIGARPGDILTVMAVTRTGAISAVDMGVRGIVQGAAKEYDDTILKLPLAHAQRLMGREDVTKIVLLLGDTARTKAVAAAIGEIVRREGLDLEIKTWDELALMYHQVQGLYRGMFVVFLSIVSIVVVFSILNTMTMSVMERVREFGTLRALGSPRTEIRRIIVVEGMVLGALGALAAFCVALGVALLVNEVKGGMQMPPPPGRTMGYQAYFDLLQHPWIWGFGLVLSLVTAMASSLLPARRASRMDIVEALRHF